MRSVIQPPATPPAIDSTSPMFTETRPISAAVKPESTQNGFTMKPIAASGSLKIRMNSSTGRMPGRDRSSISAPNIGPRVSGSAPVVASRDGGGDVRPANDASATRSATPAAA